MTVLIKQLYNDAKASCASALKQSKRITLQWRKGTFTVMTNLMISSASWAAVWALLPDQGHGWWSLGHCMADEYLLQRCNPQALPKVMELTTCQVVPLQDLFHIGKRTNYELCTSLWSWKVLEYSTQIV